MFWGLFFLNPKIYISGTRVTFLAAQINSCAMWSAYYSREKNHLGTHNCTTCNPLLECPSQIFEDWCITTMCNPDAISKQFPKKVKTQWNYITKLTLTLPGPSAGVSGSLDSYCSLKPLCSGMGEVVPARTSPTLLPPSPRTVLSWSCFKVSQYINCRDWHFKG